MTGRNPTESIGVLPGPVAVTRCPMFSVWFRVSPPVASDLKSCGRKPVRVRSPPSAPFFLCKIGKHWAGSTAQPLSQYRFVPITFQRSWNTRRLAGFGAYQRLQILHHDRRSISHHFGSASHDDGRLELHADQRIGTQCLGLGYHAI